MYLLRLYGNGIISAILCCVRTGNKMDPQDTARRHHDILSLFATEKVSNGFVAVGAPMVRYSKLEFRNLLRKHGVKLCFTPMIIAHSFNQSENARHNEFTTSEEDHPLIAQFAAKSTQELVTAAQLIYPYVDGVDVNCGCPQSWAIAKGYGCGLLKEPEKMHDMVRTIRRTLPANFSCSFKIRLLSEDVRSTVELARQLEYCGATFLTIHGRTQWQKCSHPVNVTAMAEIKKSLRVPVVVNGNVRSRFDACDLQRETNADGVMAARGLLANPAMFDAQYQGLESTPISCVQSWLDIAAAAGDNITMQCFHHHLTFMWSKKMKRCLRMQFNNFSRKEEIFNFFDDVYNFRPSVTLDSFIPYTNCTYSHMAQIPKATSGFCITSDSRSVQVNVNSNGGRYYQEFKQDVTNDAKAYDLQECFFLNSRNQ